MKKNLIIVNLGGGSGRNENHYITAVVGESCESSEVLKDLQEEWELASHIDNAVILKKIQGYQVKVVSIDQPFTPLEEKLYLVWVGWYEHFPQTGEEGVFILNLEQHAAILVVAKNSKEITEKLMSFSKFYQGQQEDVASEASSHRDNTHEVSFFSGVTFAAADEVTEVNEIIAKKDIGLF
jgi:hypothetical protein